MNANSTLRWIYIKTLAASALVAMVVALKIQFLWGASFATGALVGTLNWFILGMLLVSLTQKRAGAALGWFGGKLLLLTTMFVAILPAVLGEIGAFLLGFHMFLLMAVIEAGGYVLQHALAKSASGSDRPLPKDLKALVTGKATDA